MERTLVLVKPDAMERNLADEIISTYEKKGLHILAKKIIKPSEEIAKIHYSEHKDKPFFQNLINYITRGEVCALVVKGNNAVTTVRKINGATNPLEAEKDTIRGKYGVSISENAVHSSDSGQGADREIGIWFPEINNN